MHGRKLENQIMKPKTEMRVPMDWGHHIQVKTLIKLLGIGRAVAEEKYTQWNKSPKISE